MTEAPKHRQGQVLDIGFPLREYVGGRENSAVYVTEQCEPEARKAVIKLVPVEQGRARYEFERAGAAAKLSHPGLLRIFQAGLQRCDDQYLLYTVMEFAPENMAQVLPERPFTAAEVSEILVAALDVLQYLHQAGFVHGHLKPANIMAVEDRVRIACDSLYRPGDSLGPRMPGSYDPPEAATGPMTPAGDIWSLAVIMVEALTQQLPAWEGSERNLKLPEMLPRPFSEIARHCLRDDPRKRWTAAEIADGLRRMSPQPAAPANFLPERSTPLRARMLPSFAISGLVLAVMLIGGRVFSARTSVTQPVLPVRGKVVSRSLPGSVPSQRVQGQPVFVVDYRKPSPFASASLRNSRGSAARVLPREATASRAPAVLPSLGAIPTPRSVSSADRLMPVPGEETGRASFFSANANGGLTASGARLNSEELLAAHASYPLGSRVRVTNLANGKTIEVRIVDRFPGGPARIINVSAAAARELDFVRAGTAAVRLELVRPDAGP